MRPADKPLYLELIQVRLAIETGMLL